MVPTDFGITPDVLMDQRGFIFIGLYKVVALNTFPKTVTFAGNFAIQFHLHCLVLGAIQ